MDGDGKGQRLRGVCVGDVELFLGGAHNARRGGLCELWPMAISVTLLFRPSGSLSMVLPCGGGGFDCWAAQQHLPRDAPAAARDTAMCFLVPPCHPGHSR